MSVVTIADYAVGLMARPKEVVCEILFCALRYRYVALAAGMAPFRRTVGVWV